LAAPWHPLQKRKAKPLSIQLNHLDQSDEFINLQRSQPGKRRDALGGIRVARADSDGGSEFTCLSRGALLLCRWTGGLYRSAAEALLCARDLLACLFRGASAVAYRQGGGRRPVKVLLEIFILFPLHHPLALFSSADPFRPSFKYHTASKKPPPSRRSDHYNVLLAVPTMTQNGGPGTCIFILWL
jgi:hypothetical protein